MPTLDLQCIPAGMFQANCFIVGERESAGRVVIDPGGDADKILQAMGKHAIEMILLTHSHCDHIDACGELLEQYPAVPIACHEYCAKAAVNPDLNLSRPIVGIARTIPAPTRILADGVVFKAAGLTFKARHVPGHSPGSLVYILEEENVAFTGDTVFSGSIGRSDLPGGDGELLTRGLHAMLNELPKQMKLYPGHGSSTTVSQEKSYNPFL